MSPPIERPRTTTRLRRTAAVLKAPVVIIRGATVDDAAGIGRVHVLSWQSAYRGLMPQEHLDGLRAEQRAAGWRRYLERGERRREALLVAEDDGDVAGFAGVGPSRDEDVP